MVTICYLCGEPIQGKSTNDHVPPQQLFVPRLRKQLKMDQLVTLPTHQDCNESYGRDEEYFARTLAPVASESPTGAATLEYYANQFKAGRSVKLGYKVWEQFEERPGGLYLPHGKIIMRLEGDRIKRVAWKIVRGLYFIEHQEVLPEDTRFMLEIIEPLNEDPPKLEQVWEAVKRQPSKGTYSSVFDYKYLDAQAGKHRLHAWGMLLWDQIMVFVAHVPVGYVPDDGELIADA